MKTRRRANPPVRVAEAVPAIPPESEDNASAAAAPRRSRKGQRLWQTTPAAARLLDFDAGLYLVKIGPLDAVEQEVLGLTVPAVQIAAPPQVDDVGTEILAVSGAGDGWLGVEGGAIVVKAPPKGGRLLITTFLPPDRDEMPLAIEISRLDVPAAQATAEAVASSPMPRLPLPPSPPTRSAGPRPAASEPARTPSRRIRATEIATEILLHVEREGDRQYPGGGWVGNRGGRLRIEAFSIRPLVGIAPGDIEFMAFGPGGRETPWVSDGKLCGTRGRRLPLTGFAIRLAPSLAEAYQITYQGSFFEAGESELCGDGEPCLSAVADDPLEAMLVRLTQRRP
jgi:hypothetical protein